jgi:hypothetical protein
MEHPTYLSLLQKNADVVEFLRSQPDFVRLEVDLKAVPYNIGDWDGIDTYQAYLAGLTSNVLPFAGGGGISPQLFALTHYIGTKPIRPELQEVFRGKSGINVYRNREAFHRVWAVHEADVLARMGATGLRSKVFLAGALPPLESCNSGDEVRVTNREDNRIELDARMACRGMVILSETFFPGWQATIDGRDAKIYEADATLRGVVVESGTHRIQMRYRPITVYAGAVLTTLGLLAALLWRRSSRP